MTNGGIKLIDLLKSLEEALAENFANPDQAPKVEKTFATSDEAVEILRNMKFEGGNEADSK